MKETPEESQRLKTILQELIQKVATVKDLNLKDISYRIGVNPSVFYKYAQGISKPKRKDFNSVLEKLKELLLTSEKIEKSNSDNENSRKLDDGVVNYKAGQMAAQQSHSSLYVSILLVPESRVESYIGEDAVSGAIVEIEGIPALIAYRNKLPLGKVDGMIVVSDHGMEPKFQSGSWIVISKLKSPKWIIPGNSYYVINNDHKAFLRKAITKNDDEIELMSENKERYPNFTLKFGDLLAIFSVEKVIIDP